MGTNRTISQLRSINDLNKALYFGGSFDPPHRAHIDLPEQVFQTLKFDSLVYVPAARSPFKQSNPTQSHHRIEMLELALEHQPNTRIWTYEIDQSKKSPDQPSYWSNTWAQVKGLPSSDSSRFLIGTDQALSMHKWFGFESFWSDAIVVLRDDSDSPNTLMNQLKKLDVWTKDQLTQWESMIVRTSQIEISSTQIRNALANPTQRSHPIQGLDPKVQEYIINNALYQ